MSGRSSSSTRRVRDRVRSMQPPLSSRMQPALRRVAEEARSTSGEDSAAVSSRVSEENMRVLKRMRPEELREISRAAAALEKAKIEEKNKVDAFLAKTENFASLVGDCYICMDPLLNNIGTTKFGVLSWNCRCSIPQKAHSACLFSKVCHGQATCDMCHSPMLFEKTRRRGREATLRFHRSAARTDFADASSTDSREVSSEEGSLDEEIAELEETDHDEGEQEEDLEEQEEALRREAEARERRRQREIRRLEGW